MTSLSLVRERETIQHLQEEAIDLLLGTQEQSLHPYAIYVKERKERRLREVILQLRYRENLLREVTTLRQH